MKTVPLRRLARMRYGDALSADERHPGTVPVMSSGGITGRHDERNTGAPAIVVGRKGSHGSLFWTDEPAFVIDTAYSIDDATTNVDLRWLFYALSTLRLSDLSNDVGVPGLSRSAAYDAQLPLVPLDEQRRIADFLDDRVSRIDRIIAARREQRGRLGTLLDRQIQDILLGESARLLGCAPWYEGALLHAVPRALRTAWDVIDCKHRTPTYVDDGYPVISPGDISAGRLDLAVATRFVSHDDYLDLADDLRRCLHGDVVYSRNASAGTAAYVETSEPFTMGQDVCRITSLDQDQLYLTYCLNHLTAPQLDSYRIGSTFTRINVAQIKSLVVPVRDVSQQREMAAECDRVSAETHAIETNLDDSIELLTEYKSSLITAAVTGELDVSTAGSNIPG